MFLLGEEQIGWKQKSKPGDQFKNTELSTYKMMAACKNLVAVVLERNGWNKDSGGITDICDGLVRKERKMLKNDSQIPSLSK